MPVDKKRLRFQFGLASVFVLTVVVATILVFRVHVKAYWSYSDLSNDDIVLNGTPFGLFVELHSDAADSFRELGTSGNPWLVAALSDPSKCAAAHCLLVEINRDEFDAAHEYWDYRMDPNHNGNFSDKQIPDLIQFWKAALSPSNH